MREVEVWKDVPDLLGYQVSNFGRVRSIDRKIPRTNHWGTHYLKLRGCLMHPVVNIQGEVRYVHRLVMLAFVGPSNEHETRHLDGNKSNCHLSNLQYGTHMENVMDSHLHGDYQQKLTTAKVKEIKKLNRAGVLGFQIAERFGVTPAMISAILTGKCWKHVE